jgi:hypothetical protein
VRPGETVDIGLYWLPSKTLETDYTVFVHLLNQEINVACVRKDEPPVGGRLPSTLWRPGRYVYDHHLVPIPPSCPPGTYSIIVGLYSGPSADRLRMQSSPHTDYTTGTITVLPG